MAKSKYEYVRDFELNDSLLKHTFIVIRIDGQGFHKFTDKHSFEKPNDDRGINLMNRAALEIMKDNSEIFLAYGQSDEYSFVYKLDTKQYERRASKLISTMTSKFTSNYIFYWKEYFPNIVLQYPPSFDGRAICYPSIKTLRDYLSWRQVDCHINNMYNYCFWKLVQDGCSKQEAQGILKNTLSSDKNELLFSRFGINYNNLSQMHRKGSVIFRPRFYKETTQNRVRLPNNDDLVAKSDNHSNILIDNQFKQDNITTDKILEEVNKTSDNLKNIDELLHNRDDSKKQKMIKGKISIHHIDIISNRFWDEHYYLLPKE